jgi:hypothetical protein
MIFNISEMAAMAAALMAIVGLGAWLKKVLDSTLKPVRVMVEQMDIHGVALRSVLKNAITRTHREFKAKGFIDRFTLESVLEMIAQYKTLGGNGFISEIERELHDLPLVVPAEI